MARPHLESIRRATGKTTNIGVLDGDRVVYVDQVEGTRSVRMFTAVGTSALAHTTGSGKVIMAFGAPELLTAVYGERHTLERLTGQPCAAMSVSGPSARILHADPTEVGSLLAEHAREISEALGYRPAAGVAETAPAG